jgi:hypothetical protein
LVVLSVRSPLADDLVFAISDSGDGGLPPGAPRSFPAYGYRVFRRAGVDAAPQPEFKIVFAIADPIADLVERRPHPATSPDG